METTNKAFVIWQDTITTKRKFIIGFIEKNKEEFSFRYYGEIDEALEKGFSLLKPFDDKNKIYKSDILFPIFSSRLPDSKRKDINKILDKYNLDKYNEFDLLVKSKGKLPIDSLSFVEIIDKIKNLK